MRSPTFVPTPLCHEAGPEMIGFLEQGIGELAESAARYPNSALHVILSKAFRYYLQRYENLLDYNHTTNGESNVLTQVGKYFSSLPESTIFDVGANHGDWTRIALETCSNAKLHLFEVVPLLAEELTQNFQNKQRIVINPFGLAQETGKVQVSYKDDADSLSSIMSLPITPSSTYVTGSVKRGDDYVKEQGISEIHFLKIDVEGAEHLVLQGLKEILSSGNIHVLQFEYGKINILTHFLLIDFYDLLKDYGYVIGKISQQRVLFRNYELEHEDFLGSNFLAVRKCHQELIDVLSAH